MGLMLVDSHTHLLRLEVSPEDAVRDAADAGVGAVVNVGTDVADSRRGVELAAALPNVYSTAGIHPHNAGTYTAADLEALAELSESPGIVALGEFGLDYYRSEWSREVQTALFEDYKQGAGNPEKLVEAFTRSIPLGRIGQPDDLPGAVLFFASDDAAYVTGQVLSVSGGLTMAG